MLKKASLKMMKCEKAKSFNIKKRSLMKNKFGLVGILLMTTLMELAFLQINKFACRFMVNGR
jgi:hypothetical protein